MRKLLAIGLVLVGSFAILVPSAFAARAPHATERRVLAQASPTESVCQIGEVCDIDTGVFPGQTIDRSKVPDPAGSWPRSLTMMALLAVGFVVYLRWALAKGAKVG